MPPEMFDETTAIEDPLAIDVYAVGVINWQLWFKQQPHSGRPMQAIIMDVVQGKRLLFKGGSEQGPPPPEKLAQLIKRCWSGKVKERPSSAEVSVPRAMHHLHKFNFISTFHYL